MKKLTKAEAKWVAIIGEDRCKSAFLKHQAGDGGNTIGHEFYPYPTKGVNESLITKFGDCIINAGRKLVKH